MAKSTKGIKKRKRRYTDKEKKEIILNRQIIPILLGDVNNPYILVVVRDDFHIFKESYLNPTNMLRNIDFDLTKLTDSEINLISTQVKPKVLSYNHLGINLVIRDENGDRKRVYINYRNYSSILRHNPQYEKWLKEHIGKNNSRNIVRRNDKFYPLDYKFSIDEVKELMLFFRFTREDFNTEEEYQYYKKVLFPKNKMRNRNRKIGDMPVNYEPTEEEYNLLNNIGNIDDKNDVDDVDENKK